MTWTDERVELLKKLWADGLSASQIAAELGGVTRNAVIGKVHRLGLSGRAKSSSSGVPRQRKPRTHMMRVARPASRGANALETAPWLLLIPAVCLAITMFCFNFIGDGLRDALDPKDR